MDPMTNFKAKLALLDSMLSRMNASEGRIQMLKRSVYVLRHLLRTDGNIRSPYGPDTPIARFSLQ